MLPRIVWFIRRYRVTVFIFLLAIAMAAPVLRMAVPLWGYAFAPGEEATSSNYSYRYHHIRPIGRHDFDTSFYLLRLHGQQEREFSLPIWAAQHKRLEAALNGNDRPSAIVVRYGHHRARMDVRQSVLLLSMPPIDEVYAIEAVRADGSRETLLSRETLAFSYFLYQAWKPILLMIVALVVWWSYRSAVRRESSARK